MKIFSRIHFHPYLIGIFPVLSLYAHNQSELDPDAPWPIRGDLFGTTVTLLILRLFFKDWRKASLMPRTLPCFSFSTILQGGIA